MNSLSHLSFSNYCIRKVSTSSRVFDDIFNEFFTLGLSLKEAWPGYMDVHDSPKLKPPVILTGTARESNAVPALGLVDIGVSENAYLFQVALPGVKNDECKLKCDIQQDGTVQIRGQAVSDAEIIKDSGSEFKLRVQQLSPPGPFEISFKLPGPVDPRLVCPNFRLDGILEVVVLKYKEPNL